MYDPTYSLNEAFQKLPSRRRLKVPPVENKLFKKSFIPSAILNVIAKYECTAYVLFLTLIVLTCLILLVTNLINIANVIIVCLIKEPFRKQCHEHNTSDRFYRYVVRSEDMAFETCFLVAIFICNILLYFTYFSDDYTYYIFVVY